jgi:putative glutamine amidotransferase
MIPVAVTMRLAPAVAYDEPRDAISHDLIRFLGARGVLPILVPNVLADPSAILDGTGARAVVLSGGDDLGAPLRDAVELALVQAALARRLPILGICRGLQLINVALGGSVTADLAAAVAAETHVGTRHSIRLASGDLALVNSFHGAGVLAGGVAPSLRVLATTDGGVVEAVEDPGRAILAVQWHPERRGAPAALDRQLLDGWLARCA